MTPFQKWLLWSTSLLTGATGLVYWWMDAFLEPINEFAAINHPLQPWVLKAHIVVAPLLVFAIGVIWMSHVWRHYRIGRRRARGSGLATLALIGPMVLSGYLIQAVTAPVALTALAWIHLVGGSVYVLALVAHKVAVARSSASALDVPRSAPRVGRALPVMEPRTKRKTGARSGSDRAPALSD